MNIVTALLEIDHIAILHSLRVHELRILVNVMPACNPPFEYSETHMVTSTLTEWTQYSPEDI